MGSWKYASITFFIFNQCLFLHYVSSSVYLDDIIWPSIMNITYIVNNSSILLFGGIKNNMLCKNTVIKFISR